MIVKFLQTWPIVLWVTAAHVFANVRIRATPETREVACHLHRPLGRRQQLECDWHTAAANSRSGVEAEDFLQSYRYRRRAFVQIVNPDVVTARDLPVCWGKLAVLSFSFPAGQRAQAGG